MDGMAASTENPPKRSITAVDAMVDIGTVAVVSAVAFGVEELLSASGLVDVPADTRGASAVIVGAIAAIWLIRRRGGSFTDLGFRRPERWAVVPFQVFAILVVFVAIQALLPFALVPIFDLPQPDWSRYDDVAGNLSAAITLALLLPLGASIPEEIIYRGFLMGRLETIFASHSRRAVLVVGVQALIFSSIHFQWGVGGMVMTFVMGCVWGTAYLLTQRNLWIVIMAHSAGHLLMVTQLYFAEPVTP